jgi:hypothetical protein
MEKGASMKRLLLLIAGFSVGIGLTVGVAVTSASPQHLPKAPTTAKVTIKHQLRGCHSWSVNGGPYRAVQRTKLARGGTIKFVDTDVMPHTLIKSAGPAVSYSGKPAMRRMNASVTVTFTHPGVYRFTTKAGEDYMAGVKTIGEDNILKLTVKVS